MKLRDYQQEALDALTAHPGREAIVAHATGLGKTVLAGAWLALTLRHGDRALFLAHRDELLQQARDQLGRWLRPDLLGTVAGEINECRKPYIIASNQTLARVNRLERVLEFGRFTHVVQDECHHGAADSYQQLYARLGVGEHGGPRVLGLSATPHRADGKALAWPIVHEISLRDGIARGYLSDIQTETVSMEGPWQARVRRGDFDVNDLERSLLSGNGPAVIAEALRCHPDRKSLVFTPTVATAEAVAAACQEAGLPSMAIHGKLSPALRVHGIGAFREGELRALTNCAVLTEGFDEPAVSCILLARPTRSRGLFLQMLGRGTRKHPDKDNLLVIDLAGATARHDLVSVATVLDLPVELPPGSLVGDVLRSKRVNGRDLADLRPYAWVRTTVGWALSFGEDHGTMLLRQHPTSGHWMIYQLRRKRPKAFVATALDLEDGQNLVESLAVERGVSSLVRKDQGWRMAPASIGQRRALEKFGVNAASSRGAAADQLTKVITELAWRR